MRLSQSPRLVAVLVAAVALGAAAVAALAIAERGEPYRFAAVFDTAKGMVAGQQVKIAGAVVGTVEAVELTDRRKALMRFEIEERFAPLRADATCRILPEGLISESYVECDPGSAAEELPVGEAGIPTVKLKRTQTPLALQDLLNVFAQPADLQLRALLNEMGIATAGRGSDINAILRRANPALAESNRVLAILGEQRGELMDAVRQTDEVIDSLAERDEDVRAFVDRAASVAEATAENSGPLGEAIRRLPAFLDEARTGLTAIDAAAERATPLLGHLERSAPGLERLTRALPAFAERGPEALRALRSAAKRGRQAVRALDPPVDALGISLDPVGRVAKDLDDLLVSTRDTGGIEGLLRLIYALTTMNSAYDSVSHAMSFHIAVAPHCLVLEKTNIDFPGCSHTYSAPHQGRLPINDPGCGPKDGLWMHQRCQPPPPGTGILGGLPFDLAGLLKSLRGDGEELRRALNKLGLDGDSLVGRLLRDIDRKRQAGERNAHRGGLADVKRVLDFLMED